MSENQKTKVCLFCKKNKCEGETKCFKERRKEYLKKYNADRRKGEKALNYICNVEYAKAKREALKKALNSERTSRNGRETVEGTGDEQVEAVTKR